MTTNCYGLTDQGQLRDLPCGDLSSGPPPGCTWIDVQEYGDEELASLLRSLGFSSIAVRTSGHVRGQTRVNHYGDEVYFELPALAADIGAHRVPLAFLCREGLCVTIHREPVEGLARTVTQLRAERTAIEDGTSGLVSALLAGLSRRMVDAVDEIRRRVLDMQERMDQEGAEVEAAEIHDHGSAVRTLDGVIGERMVVLDRLDRLQSPALALSGIRDFGRTISDVQYLDRSIDRLEKRLADLRQQFSLAQQERTNRRLAVLTVLSAVFLPLTLIAGIYGMNFEVMPELGYPLGYPIVIGVMILLGLGMVGWFRWQGWFD